jgi:hypothetical protein
MATPPARKKRVHAIFADSAVRLTVDDDFWAEQIAALLSAAGRGHGTPIAVEISALTL